MVSVHGFLGPDEPVNAQIPARSERQWNFDALPQDGVKISDAKNLTKAIQDTQIGFQVQVLQSVALFRPAAGLVWNDALDVVR